MLRKYLSFSFVFLGLALIPAQLGHAQNPDFAHGMVTASSLYPTQSSVLQQITYQTQSYVNNGTQPLLSCALVGGYSGNDVADAEWGTLAELAFWWYNNNGSTTGFTSLNQSGHAAITQTTYQTFAQNEMDFTQGTNGGNPCDIPDTGMHSGGNYYLRQVNGYQYAKYTSNETQVSTADVEETGLSLAYKAMIYQYNTTPLGVSLFTPSELSLMMTSAISNWNWLTIDAVYNPQHTANQEMISILGGYWLGMEIATDTTQFGSSAQNMGTAQMAAALSYYDGGLANSNLPPPNGFRQTDTAINPQGYKYFTEHYRCIEPTTPPTVLYDPNSNGTCVYNGTQITPQLDGFDTHYGGLQVSELVQLMNLMNQGKTLYGSQYLNTNVAADALGEAQYSSVRLSQAGTMHGGSRHNEIGSTATDLTFGAGYNYFGAASQLNDTLGRTLVTDDRATAGSGHATSWGHRFAQLIMLYLNYQPWVTTPLTVNNLASLHKNSVSLYFDNGNQPQEIAVGGTVLTDALRGSVQGSTGGLNTAAIEDGINGKAQGLQIVDASSKITNPAVMSPPAYYSTTNFQLHTVSGTATVPGGTANLRHIYATDGTSLYILSLVQFPTGSSAINSVSSVLGIPYISTKNRIVDVLPVSSLSTCTGPYSTMLDMSAGAGSCTGTALKTGDVNLYAWPQIVAEDVASASTLNEWMSNSSWNTNPNYNLTLDGLSNLNTPVYYYPNSSSAVLNDTDDIRTQMQPLAGSTSYNAGDLIASVVRIAPTSVTTTLAVTPNYATNSGYNLAGCTTSPCLDVEDGSTTSGPSFTVLPSGLVTFTDKAAKQSIPSVGTPAFQIQATPASLILAKGQNGTMTVSIPSAGNYVGTVTFTVTGLPASITAQFAPTSLSFTGLNDTKTTTATFTRSATAQAKPMTGLTAPVASVFALLLPLLVGKRKVLRELRVGVFSACLLGLVLFAATGCSTSVAPPTVIPAVNTVHITATDGTNTSTIQVLITTS